MPLSLLDIREFLPKAQMLVYSEFKKIKNIDEIFNKKRNYMFIIYQGTGNLGHWVVLLRRGRIIEFFDSYGDMIDTTFNWIPVKTRRELGQADSILTKLLIGSNYKIHFNQYRYQGKRTMTCGRWCLLRAVFIDLNEDEFHKLINKAKKAADLTNDQLAVSLTPLKA